MGGQVTRLTFLTIRIEIVVLAFHAYLIQNLYKRITAITSKIECAMSPQQLSENFFDNDITHAQNA